MKRIRLLTSMVMVVFMVGACSPAVDRGLRIENQSLSMDETVSEAEEVVDEERSTSMFSGIIMPHHDLAREMIELAWQESLKVEPDFIILMGPDHPGLASYPLIWTEETDKQVSFICSEIANVWIKDGLGGGAIVADHSIESPLKFLPEEARDIPVLAFTLPRGMEAEGMDRMIEAILEISGNCLLVGSVDFSHGLPSGESQLRDEESFDWIKNRDYPVIRDAGNEYFDSPETIEVLLRCLTGDVELIERCDSSDIAWSEDLPGTSYQVMRFNQ